MAIYEREETFAHWITLRDRDSVLSDPTTITITITSPCGTVLTDTQNMTQDSTGIYNYYYHILTNAIYGQNKVVVEATTGSAVSTFVDFFWIMPWNIVDEVRTISGQTEKKISDDDLSLIVWNAFREVIQNTMEYHFHEHLCCCADGICSCGNIECDCTCGCSGLCSSPICSDNGSSYKLKNTPISDWQIDNAVHGCDCQDTNDECHNDICGIWIDGDGICHDASVKVINATCGEIEVYRGDPTDCSLNIPADNQGIYINYHSTWRTYNLTLFKKAVMYLAYYELAQREFLDSKLVAGCDEGSRVAVMDRIYNQYRNLLDNIRRPMLGGVK